MGNDFFTMKQSSISLKELLLSAANLSTFEFGGHANLVGLSLLDVRASLDSPIHFLEWFAIEIGCIFVPKSVQICLQSSKICPPNSNVDKCAKVALWTKLAIFLL